MPWKETCVVDQRVRFIAAVQEDPRGNFSRLCERFGIARSVGYKWVERYNELGPAGLADRESVARACPHKTPDAVEDRVVALRKRHPFDGPKKLRQRLLDIGESQIVVPAASTIGEILDRYGLIRPARARLRVPPSTTPLAHAHGPNDVWSVDFKGHFATSDGARCYPLTISDNATRFLIKCESLREQKDAPVREQFELAFQEFGLPARIRSDNGAPFASKAVGGLSRLSVWWIQLGIIPERIEPGHPEQNGRHERMHKTLKEQTASPPATTLADQQRAFDRFRADYNNDRPHEALGQTPPRAHYEPSLRVMPESLREPEYGSDFVLRRVQPSGRVGWHGPKLPVSKLLAGQHVGFKQIDDDEWALAYGPVLLGYVLRRNGKLRINPP
jgi:transposase InsO family protein